MRALRQRLPSLPLLALVALFLLPARPALAQFSPQITQPPYTGGPLLTAVTAPSYTSTATAGNFGYKLVLGSYLCGDASCANYLYESASTNQWNLTGSLGVNGIVSTALSPSSPTVTATGGTGTTWYYCDSQSTAAGESTCSLSGSVSGGSPLSGTVYNTISGTVLTGANAVTIYQCSSSACTTTYKMGSATITGSSYSYKDTSGSTAGAGAPTTDASSQIIANGVVLGGGGGSSATPSFASWNGCFGTVTNVVVTGTDAAGVVTFETGATVATCPTSSALVVMTYGATQASAFLPVIEASPGFGTISGTTAANAAPLGAALFFGNASAVSTTSVAFFGTSNGGGISLNASTYYAIAWNIAGAK